MRLWTIHPKHLDAKGLVALWREALLAKKVLEGKTKGYTRHPELDRFRKTDNPLKAINYYLQKVYEESLRRGYSFSENKFEKVKLTEQIDVTSGQVAFECDHLLAKLKVRDNKLYMRNSKLKKMDVHPLFNHIEKRIEK